MIKIKNILFPTDYSECAEHAFTHAAYLASHFDATLHVVHVRGIDGEVADPFLPQARPEQSGTDGTASEGRLPEGSGYTETGGLPKEQIEEVILWDSAPDRAILEYARAQAMDLIVMGTHGRRGLDRALLGSVAESVVREASCPVYTVQAGMDRGPTEHVHRILVPIDFSASSKAALLYAKDLARAYDAQLVLLHLVHEMVYPVVYGIEPIVPQAAHVAHKAIEALKELGKHILKEEVPFTVEVHIGNPIRDIGAYAETEGVDMIVIATHGLTGLRHLLMGSVTERVIRTAPCPVFTVKTVGHLVLDDAAVPTV